MSKEAGHAHPSNRIYIVIAVILGVLTAMEVMVFYVEALAPVLVPVLMTMMAVKFALVAMFFMHLKFDNKLLTGIFLWGLFVAISVMLMLMAMFGKFTG